LFVLCFCLVSKITAQGTGLNISIIFEANNITFEKVMEGFESRTGVFIQYNAALVAPSKKYNVSYRNIRAKQALIDFLEENGLTFSQTGNQIILKKITTPLVSKRFIASGRILQKLTGEVIGYAEISNSKTGISVFSSDAGYFTGFLSTDTNILVISYPGYKSIVDTLTGDRDYFLKYELEIEPGILPEAEIKGNTPNNSNQTITLGQTDQYRIAKVKMRRLPHLLGEPDILHVMSLFPGIVGGSEGMLGLYIRGGASDQNLMLLDDVPVFNSYHLYGIFSVFNDEVVKSANLMKGSFPARYGGRLSSVINVQSKEGNEFRLKGSLSIGLMASKIFIEGPLIKNRTTFTLALRRSQLDFLAGPAAKLFFNNDSIKNNLYYFWDLNARITHRFSNRSRLSLSFYMGRDVGGIDEKQTNIVNNFNITERKQQLSSWGNILGSIKWNYYVGKRTTIIVKGHISGYDYSYSQNYRFKKTSTDNVNPLTNDFTEYKLKNGISDLEGSFHISNKISNHFMIETGAGYTVHKFIPGDRSLSSDINGNKTELVFNDPKVNTPEIFSFLEISGNIKERIYYTGGVRYAAYIIDALHIYYLPEPRFNLRYKSGKNTWIKIAAMRTRQFFHQLTNLTLGLPSDLWVPSTLRYAPSGADQASLGFSHEKKEWQFSSEIFYKVQNNLLEYKNNAGYVTSAVNWEDAVTNGSGKAYGWEMMLERTKGRLTGWISYTWMKNLRQFKELNEGHEFPSRYDRRNNIYVAGVYKINDNIDFAISWTYNSGFAITTPIGHYYSGTSTDPYREIFIYGDRNNTRTRDNHRLDFAFNFEKKKSGYTRIWSVGIFNVYNRRNPFYVTMGYDAKGNRALSQVSLLPILPNISYKISF
jgi:hypothetical protein